MTNALDLGRIGPISNGVYNGITANSTAITSISVGNTSINSTSITINGSPVGGSTETLNTFLLMGA